KKREERSMRPLILSVVAGLAVLGLIVLSGRADEHHSVQHQMDKSYQGRLDSHPRSGRLDRQPPTEPYRSAFFFPTDPPARPKEDEVSDVTLYDNYFSPSYLMVASGKTVRFTNRGRHEHTTTCNWLWESGNLERGTAFVLTFSRPGRYYYYCRHHRDMRGTIVVY